MNPDLQRVRDLWDTAAQRDAMGHILTNGRAWNTDDFYAHGRAELDACLARLDQRRLRGKRRVRALDFGCGMGRVTQALADHYEIVDGVDASQTMIELATAHNRWPNRVHYSVSGERLRFPDGMFDLVYTMIVLQHMPQRFAHAYIRDFVRILHSDGIAVFEIPDGPDVPHQTACLSMYGTPRAQVEQIVADAGGLVVDVENVNPCEWDCNRYTAIPAR